MKNDCGLIAEHRRVVGQYLEVSLFAASAPLGKPLPPDNVAAYLTLPYLMDEAQALYNAIPPDYLARPLHYLMTVSGAARDALAAARDASPR